MVNPKDNASKCFSLNRVNIAFTFYLRTLQRSTRKSSRSCCLEFLLQTPASCTVMSPHRSSAPKNSFSYIFQMRCCGWYNKLCVKSCQCSLSMQQVNNSCVHFILTALHMKDQVIPTCIAAKSPCTVRAL